MKFTILLVSLALVTGTSLVFAGGGNQSSSPSSDGSPAAAPSNKTITVNVQAGVGAEDAWKAVADGYKKYHPDVNIVIDLKPSEGYREWVVNAFLVSNPTADIVNVNWSRPESNGKCIDFNEYLDQTSPYSNKRWREQFNVEMQKPGMWNGQMPMLSFDAVQVLWLYNKDIFAKVGVQPPKTWNELITVCDKLQKAGYQPISMAGDYPSFQAGNVAWLMQVYYDQTTRNWVNIIRAQPGDYCYDPDIDNIWKYDPTDPYNDDGVTLNPVRWLKAIDEKQIVPASPGAKALWQNFAKIFPKYVGGEAFFGTADPIPLFYQGKAAMIVDGAWRLLNFKIDMDKLSKGEEILSGEKTVSGVQKFDLGTFNMPSMEGPEFQAKARTLEVATGFLGAVKKDRAHDDMVTDFMMYLSSTEGYSKFINGSLDAGGSISGPPLVYGVQLEPDIQVLFQNLVFVGNVQKGHLGKMFFGLGNSDAERNFYDYAYGYLSGKNTIDQFMTNFAGLLDLDYWLSSERISRNDLKNPQNAPTGQ
jgi:ABC-type glycerol-3-phosphate transport system substrate-binding protein